MKLTILTFTLVSFLFRGFSTNHPIVKLSAHNADTVFIPLGGNAWRTGRDTSGGYITNTGIANWTDRDVKFTTYVRLTKKGNFKLWISPSIFPGKSTIAITALKTTKLVSPTGFVQKYQFVGEWTVTDTGYLPIQIKGIAKSGYTFAATNSIKLAGSAINSGTAFVKNNEGNFFYWGRRGPSVHLGYLVPDNLHAEWFYNEVTVPKGNDVTGSYFMADGFAEGYFGMQVNSSAERRILFSVWSPFKTDDPKQIPGDQKIIMLKKGANVHAGEFGDEGSGGQSYLVYNWKPGNTYKFLIHAKPDQNNHTVYTAYFFATEIGKWQLIASFSRPQTNTYLKHLHSFLENFDPDQGAITREVLFTNQWVADENVNGYL
ncbi:MAG: nematoblast specific protein [Mucilaginibacter sp.]|nr:nematoblast specific protein [Mucilaginibacter sp.]